MADRLADNIRRIVGLDKKKSRTLNTAPVKESIPGNRGASFAPPGSSGATNSVSVSGTAGQNMSSNAQAFPPSGYSYGAGGNGSYTDPNYPEKAILNGDGNSFSVEDVLDGNGPAFYDPTQTDGSGLDALRDSVDTLTGITDCESGKDICLYMKNGAPPPDGWVDVDDPGDPPAEDEWIQGSYWRPITNECVTGGTTTHYGATLNDSIKSVNAAWISTEILGVYTCSGTRYSVYCRVESITPGNYNLQWYGRFSGCTPGDFEWCPVEDPTGWSDQDWPEDGCHALGFEDGQFTSYDREPAADKVSKLTGTQSRVDFCFGSGRFGTIEVTQDGGYMIYETASEGGAISGQGIRFSSTGVALATITDAAELVQYRP